MALVRLGRYSWPSRRASLPSTQDHPVSRLSSPLPMRHASTNSNNRGEDPYPCGRSLLHVCLAGAAVAVSSYWYGVCVVGWWERCVCLGGVCDSHQIALHSKTLIHHIVDPAHSGFEPEVALPEREPQQLLWFCYCCCG